MKDPMSFSIAVAICSNLDTDSGKFTEAEIGEAIDVIIKADNLKWVPKKALWNVILWMKGEI